MTYTWSTRPASGKSGDPVVPAVAVVAPGYQARHGELAPFKEVKLAACCAHRGPDEAVIREALAAPDRASYCEASSLVGGGRTRADVVTALYSGHRNDGLTSSA